MKRTCRAGYYTSGAPYTSCQGCTAGNYCPDAYSINSCGSYVVSPPYATASGSCNTPGLPYYSTGTTISNVGSCDTGQYRPNIYTCSDCPTGSYCATPAQTGTSGGCGSGTYSNAKMMYCMTCTPGYYCSSGSRNSISGNYYDGVGPGSGPSTYYNCPAGSYCPYPYWQIACPSGYYSGLNSGSCTPCNAGSYCTSVATNGCSAGYWSADRQTGCIQTKAGFASAAGATQTGISLCGPGTYSGAASGNCPGCSGGNYCPGGAQITCPVGYYCSGSTVWPVLCQPATYCSSGYSSQGSLSSGQVTLYGHITVYSAASDGFGHYYQSGKSFYHGQSLTTYFQNYDAETACPSGTYCRNGFYVACPYNTHTFYLASATSNTVCASPPYGNAGYLDVTPNLNIVCYSAASPKVVRYSNQAIGDCFQCGPDQDCMYQNQYFPFSTGASISCPLGSYGNTYDLTCKFWMKYNNYCPYGYYAEVVAADANNHNAEKQILCKEYGLFGGANSALASTWTSCVIGTWTLPTFSDCIPSPPGFINAKDNTVMYAASDMCPQGYYCQYDYDFTASAYFTLPHKCPFGTYARTTYTGGKSEGETCMICEEGSYCPGDSSKVSCPDGYICERGAKEYTLACPGGYYFDTAATGKVTLYERCKQCPSNYACPSFSTDTSKVQCPKGYKCPIGTYSPTSYSADPGKIIAADGGSEAACDAGYFCPQGSYQAKTCPVIFFFFCLTAIS